MKKHITTLLFCFSLAVCSSAPSWDGLSESEIVNWKNLGVNVEQVQVYRKQSYLFRQFPLGNKWNY